MTIHRFKTAGYDLNDEKEELNVKSDPSSCGTIRDGVVMSHGRDGSWVIAFADLKRIYEIACEARGERSTS